MTNLLVVDSSIWIDHLRDRAPAASSRLAAALGDGRGSGVRMCEPVAMELIAGASTTQLPTVMRIVDGLPSLPLDSSVDFRSAGDLARQARAAGRTVRSNVDCLIAALAIRHDVLLVHRDRDFDELAAVSDLRAERWD